MHCGAPNCEAPAISRSMCKPHYDKWWSRTPAKDRPVPAAKLNEISEVEAAWLAGLIEGEGTFFCSQRRDRRYPVIAVGMTDEDVIRKAHMIAGVGTIQVTSIRGLMKKMRFTWKVGRTADVFALARLLRPHMGIRRTGQLDDMLANSRVKYIEANL